MLSCEQLNDILKDSVLNCSVKQSKKNEGSIILQNIGNCLLGNVA
jgi:hypothetical protein